MSVKAWVVKDKDKIEQQEFDYPSIEEDAGLLKIEAVGICGSDKHLLNGKGNMPLIAGHEVIGTIEEIGDKAFKSLEAVNNEPLKKGDRVAVAPPSQACGECFYCFNMPHRSNLCANRKVFGFANCEEPPHLFGAYAEYMYLHPRSWIFKVPERLPLEKAVLTEPTTIALRAAERAMMPGEPFAGHGLGIGKSVAVYGAGPIGCLIIAILRYMGAGKIIATDMVSERLEMAKTVGADYAINISEVDYEARSEEIKSLTSGVGPDVTIEAAGAPQAFEEAIQIVRRGGKVVEVGHYTDNGEVNIRPFVVCNKDVDIHGSWSAPPILFQDSLDFLARTDLPVTEIITHYKDFQEVPDAIRMLGQKGVGKVVIKTH